MLISNNYISLYTPNKQASQIVYIIKKYCNKKCTIVDANAGMGGNSVYFCKNFDYVYCIDTSKEAIIYLEHNLKNYDNKFIINEDCLNILKLIKYDVVFFDPPWGGSCYKFKNVVNLYLNNIDINNIVESLYYYCNVIALKVPSNFNLINSKLWNIKMYNIYKNNNISIIFKLIIFYKNK